MAGPKNLYKEMVEPFLENVTAWRREGLTEIQIFERLGVGKTSATRYKKKYPEFRQALLDGKKKLVGELEDSLYKRAKGFEYEEMEVSVRDDGSGKRIRKTKKYIVPDVGALCFALKNLAPEKWRDKQDVNISGELGVKVVDNVPEDDDDNSSSD
jgi:hypothetical protein